MIIDCHGHYTTAPGALQAFRDAQIAGLNKHIDAPSSAQTAISDREIRDSLENAQLKLQRERGTDLTIFSPRASAMAHHIGNETTSQAVDRSCATTSSTASARSIPTISSGSASCRSRPAYRPSTAPPNSSAASRSSASSAAT